MHSLHLSPYLSRSRIISTTISPPEEPFFYEKIPWMADPSNFALNQLTQLFGRIFITSSINPKSKIALIVYRESKIRGKCWFPLKPVTIICMVNTDWFCCVFSCHFDLDFLGHGYSLVKTLNWKELETRMACWNNLVVVWTATNKPSLIEPQSHVWLLSFARMKTRPKLTNVILSFQFSFFIYNNSRDQPEWLSD